MVEAHEKCDTKNGEGDDESIAMNVQLFFRDIYAAESRGELERIGECTISLCYKPGVIAFGVWVMCREHATQYLDFRKKGKEKNADQN